MQVADEPQNDDGAEPQDARTALVNVLKEWNAADAEETVGELLSRVEREDREARETARAEALATQIAALNQKLDSLTAQTAPQPPRLTRLGLSAADKSRYIRTHGLERYNHCR
jgi:hypothetical protein